MKADAPEGDGGEVERSTHSFVLRLWREEAAARDRRPFWRGTITHLPGGERQTVQRMGEIVAFIALYIEQLGVRVALAWRVLSWVRRPMRQADRGEPGGANGNQ